MIRTRLIAILMLSAGSTAFAHDHSDGVQTTASPKGISFIENKGQWVSEAKFKAEIPGGVMFLTDKGFVYNFVSDADLSRIHNLTCGPDAKEHVDLTKEFVRHHAYKVNFIGTNSNVNYTTTEKRKQYHNYFIGNDQSKWAGSVGLFGTVEQANIYNGVTLKVYTSSETSNNVKYDFVVAPGADVSQINMSFEGVQPQLTKDGHLRIKTSVNEVIEQAPYTYQVVDGRKVAVDSRYVLKDGVLSFEFPKGYNDKLELIIDPDLVFVTFSGGTGSGTGFYAHTTTYDSDGNLYAGSKAYQAGWPTNVGSFQAAFGGAEDAGINKYSSDGSTLIYSTYYGGNSSDHPLAMLVNSSDELVVVGYTGSTNLPVTTGCYDNTLGGTYDIFVAHFNNNGSALIGATYVGGSSQDPILHQFSGTTVLPTGNPTRVSSPLELTFDAAGNIWVVGNTSSTDFPVTSNAQQAALSGGTDAVIFKLNPTCTTLMYSSFLGGTSTDSPTGLIFNEAGNLVLCGYTSSTNFPTTTGALITTAPGGAYDGFVSIINPANGAILQSTYLGTPDNDQAVAVRVDCSDNVYVLGRTLGNYPISPGVWSMAGRDVFIHKLNSTLSTSILSTRLGNNQGSATSAFYPSGFLVDICGNVYVGGDLASSGMPLTPDAVQTNQGSFWLCTLEPNFGDLAFASYLGLTGDHSHIGVNRFDPDGFAYYSICCISTTYPGTTANSWAPTKLSSSQDIVSFKFNFEANPIKISETSSAGGMDTATHCIRGCKSAFVEVERLNVEPEPTTIRFTETGTATRPNGDYQLLIDGVLIPTGVDSFIIPSNVAAVNIEVKPLLRPFTGPLVAQLNILSPCGCDGGGDQIVEIAKVTIYDSLFVEFLTPLDTVCPLTPISITAQIDTTLNYEWSPIAYNQGSLTINPIPSTTSRYSITVRQPGAPLTCPPRRITYEAFVEPQPIVTFNPKEVTVCLTEGDSLDINGYIMPQDGTQYVYQWSPGTYLRNTHDLNNKFYAPVGDYYQVLEASTPVAGCSAIDSLLIHVVPPFTFQNIYPSDTTIKMGDTVRLDTRSNAILWYWTPQTYLDDAFAKDPLARPLETTTYQVVGIDQYGCRDTADVTINVEFASLVGLPNAFTPNGDGLNDVFRIENRFFEKMTEFKVYNRLGQLVYDGLDPNKGWDGTIKGVPAANDVYFYRVQLTMPGGVNKVYQGDVTLMR